MYLSHQAVLALVLVTSALINAKSIGNEFGDCQDVILEWSKKQWGPDIEGHILVKAAGAPALEDWSLEIELDRPVTQCNDFNAKMTKISDVKYRASSQPWNAKVPVGHELVSKLHISWDTGAAGMPRPVSLVINGKTYDCTGAKTTSGPTLSPVTDTLAPVTHTLEPVTPTPTPVPTLPPTPNGRGIYASWPNKVLGLYVILADDYDEGYNTDTQWSPKLYEYQQKGANVLFFTFINPDTMKVPVSFQNLAATRGQDIKGAVPKDTVIIFAIGGISYSTKINPWSWLTSKENAEAMAAQVAKWPELYGCDGIDLDIEDGAGNARGAGTNMVHFIRKLRELSPKIIISQPTYGYPSIGAEIEAINSSWDADSNSNNLEDSIGIMVYEGTQALNYVKNFVNGADQWQGFPITCRAPTTTILLGAKGTTGSSNLATLAKNAISKDYRGIMVWFVSVPDGLVYQQSWDGSDPAHQQSFIDTLELFKPYNTLA